MTAVGDVALGLALDYVREIREVRASRDTPQQQRIAAQTRGDLDA